MYRLSHTGQFKKDLKACKKRGYELEKLSEIIKLLVIGVELPFNYKNHRLVGKWKGCFDAHIESDWLLIYEYLGDELILMRTGTHSDLF